MIRPATDGLSCLFSWTNPSLPEWSLAPLFDWKQPSPLLSSSSLLLSPPSSSSSSPISSPSSSLSLPLLSGQQLSVWGCHDRGLSPCKRQPVGWRQNHPLAHPCCGTPLASAPPRWSGPPCPSARGCGGTQRRAHTSGTVCIYGDSKENSDNIRTTTTTKTVTGVFY